MRIFLALLLAVIGAAACNQSSGPTLIASEFDLRTAIPGRGMAPGYLTLTNNGTEPLRIDRIESPQFGRIEIHETTNVGQVSRMRKLEALPLPANSSVELAPGGLHLMLFSAQQDVERVTLNFYSGDALVLSATAGLNK